MHLEKLTQNIQHLRHILVKLNGIWREKKKAFGGNVDKKERILFPYKGNKIRYPIDFVSNL